MPHIPKESRSSLHYAADSVPQGRLSVAQDDSPGFRQLRPKIPVGTTESYPRTTAPVIFSRPYGTHRAFKILPRTVVLGYTQPSLRDWLRSVVKGPAVFFRP